MFVPNLKPEYGNEIKYDLINYISNELFKDNTIVFKFKREKKYLPLEAVYYYGLTLLSQNRPYIEKLEDLDLKGIPIADDITLDGIHLYNLNLTKKPSPPQHKEEEDEYEFYDSESLQDYYIYDGTRDRSISDDYRFKKYADAGIEFDPLEVINIEALDNEKEYYDGLHEAYLDYLEEEKQRIEDEKKEFDPKYETESQYKYRKRRKELISTLEDIKDRIVDDKGKANSQYLSRLLRNGFNHISWYPDREYIHLLSKQKDGKSLTFSYNIKSFSDIVITYYKELTKKIIYRCKKLYMMEDKYAKKSAELIENDSAGNYYEELAFKYHIKIEKLMNNIQELGYYLYTIKKILDTYGYEFRYNAGDFCNGDSKYYSIQREEIANLAILLEDIIEELEQVQYSGLLYNNNAESFEKNGVLCREKVLLNILFVQENIEDIVNIVDYSQMKIYSFDQTKNISKYEEKIKKECEELSNLISKNNQIKKVYDNNKITKEKYENIRSARDKRINQIIEDLRMHETKYNYYKYDGKNTDLDKYSITNHIRNANAHGNIYISDKYNQIVTIVDIDPETDILVFYATIPLIDLLRPFYKKGVLEDLFGMNNVVKDVEPNEVSIISK